MKLDKNTIVGGAFMVGGVLLFYMGFKRVF